MRISTIAVANLRRRRGKALFLTAGISIGIGTVVALLSLSGSIREEIGSQLDRFGANIVVVPQSNSLALDYGGISVSGVSFDVHQLTDEDAKRILQIPYRKRLSVVAPKLLSAVQVEGKQVLLAGVDFAAELRLKRWWHISGQKPQTEGDILLGYDVARALSVIDAPTQAEETSVMGAHHESDELSHMRIRRDSLQIADRAHHVAGIIGPTGGPEDRMIFGSLAHVQALLGKQGQLSIIEVSALCKDCPVNDIVSQIGRELPYAKVSAVQQAIRARSEAVDRLTKFSTVVSAVVLAIGALMIFTTMMGSVIERTKEIGVLRAIGFRRSHIIKELMIEVGAISTAGGLIGWAAGTVASWVSLPYFSETRVPFELHSALMLFAVGVAVVIGLLSSIYPAMRASGLDPSEAVRYV
jgi:putative ABC transport system permease protein